MEEQSQCASKQVNPIEQDSIPSVQDSDKNEEQFVDLDGSENDTANTNKRKKKLTSEVWEYFTKKDVNGVVKAMCNYCKATLSAGGANGTSHLLKHARTVCPGRHFKLARGQSTLKVQKEVDGSSSLEFNVKGKGKGFDQEHSRKMLVSMIIMHEYPLSMVEHIGFRRHVESLNCEFKMISRATLKRDIMKQFKEDKLGLKGLLEHNDSRVAITTDMWTASNQKKSYMVVTSHFIDQQWRLRNRTLKFVYAPCPHTKGVLAKILMDCLSQFSLESKISSVVVDNCTTNEAMMKVLLDKFEKKSLILGGSCLHMRCSAHVLNLIVQDGLEVIYSGIEKIRDCVAFWMSTPKRIEKFEEACRFLELPNKRLILDCKTRWNSTFLMLQAVLPFREVFARLKRLNKRMKFEIPSDHDWYLAGVVCEKLEIFYKTTNLFSGTKFVTINLFFRRVCINKQALAKWESSDIDIVRLMAKKMIEKFDKYWKRTSGLLAIATILDPRNKMDCVEFYFRKFYEDDADRQLSKVRKCLDDLVVEYQSKIDTMQNVGATSKKRPAPSSFEDEEDEFAQSKKTKIQKVNVKCEVDFYLEEDPLPDDDDLDIISWWKVNRKYPTLRKIAKDILAIPVSSVASESAFSTGGRVISPHRSRLHSETVEDLMCLQNWMMEDLKGEMENTHACSTIIDDSEITEVNNETFDVIDMDLDGDDVYDDVDNDADSMEDY